MEVYLIRHTTPVFAPGVIYGRSELALSDGFPAEMEAVMGHLPAKLDCVYSSPASRCTKLAEAIDPAFKIDERLQELDFGHWEGLTWNTVDQVALKTWMDDYVHACVPGGESMLEMHRRVRGFWEELLFQKHENLALVTHAGVIRLILAEVRNIPLVDIFDIKVAYGEVFRVQLLPKYS